MARHHARPITPRRLWNLQFLAKLTDCDVGDAEFDGNLAGRALPYQCEEFFSRHVALGHSKVLPIKLSGGTGRLLWGRELV